MGKCDVFERVHYNLICSSYKSKLMQNTLCWHEMFVFCRFIARPCAMGLKIQANGPQKAQPNAILEKVFTAITKVGHAFLYVLLFIIYYAAKNNSGVCIFRPASRWEEVGGSVEAARLGCAHHPALVPAATQPGEAEHSRQILRKHVRQHSVPILAANALFQP